MIRKQERSYLLQKELLEYLFDYLHPDREGIVDIELYETESRLCYKWKN